MKTNFEKIWYALNIIFVIFAYAVVIYNALFDCDVSNKDIAVSILMSVIIFLLKNPKDENKS